MKTLSIFFVALLVSSSLFASDPTVAAVSAEASNLRTVVDKIDYPLSAQKSGLEGRVIVKLKVNKQGKVVGHRVLLASDKVFASPVKNVLDDLVFTPAIGLDGENVSSSVIVPVYFKLTAE
jgi:TonB family protein